MTKATYYNKRRNFTGNTDERFGNMKKRYLYFLQVLNGLKQQQANHYKVH